MTDVNDVTTETTWSEKARALYRVVRFQPVTATAVVVLSVLAALLEGAGLSFIMPIIEITQVEDPAAHADGLLGVFVAAYDIIGVPFTLSFLIAGVAVVMTIRFTCSFLVGWFRAIVETRYVRHLQEQVFEGALDSEVAHIDDEGSDNVLNVVVTQSEYAGQVVKHALFGIEQGLLAVMYFLLAVALAPVLAIGSMVLFGITTYLFRNVLSSGGSLGDEVAGAKEGIQSFAQAGTQGIRDVKLFGLVDYLRDGFEDATDRFERNRIKLLRNESAVLNFYQLLTALTVFVLIYVALTFSSMSVGELGVFFFAMFRLSPKVSNLNKRIYRVEGELPHLIRTQEFLRELDRETEASESTRDVPSDIRHVEFEDVEFSYESDETVLDGIDFAVEEGEMIGFVGRSGAGKSTIVSLLAGLYDQDVGEIRANREPISAFDLDEWRERLGVVRQDPYIFNETLRFNLTVGRDVSPADLEEACEIARVDEFLDDLRDGYDTQLGDDGVKLSGGQRQRVAIARALLKDADVLALDEATSDLDSHLEEEVHAAIEEMDEDYIVVVIAHRLQTVRGADRIYTLERGEITEVGRHEALLEKDGTYAELYAKQS